MYVFTPFLFFVALFQEICKSPKGLKLDSRSGNLLHYPLKTSSVFCYAFLFIFFYILVDLCSEIDHKRIYILLILYLKFFVSTNRNFLQIFSHFYSFSN
jgi:hypothetical protein